MDLAARSEVSPATVADICGRLAPVLGPVTVLGDDAVEIVAVEHDHRTLSPTASPRRGTLYCCLRGALHDGHDHAAEARAGGAVAFVCERDLGAAADGAPQVVVPPGAARQAMALAACVVEHDPAGSLATIGVTGTNGKTTTTHLIVSILAAAGYEAGLVGTLSGERTTPEANELQRRLAAMASAARVAGRPGAAAMEVTSHALVQHRVDGYVHDVAVFTNLSQDHLDYHGTMEAYFEAKATLFTPEHAERAVVNADDGYGRRLLERQGIETVPFSLAEAGDLSLTAGETRFLLRGHEVHLGLIGQFNVENALAAAAAARALGVDDAVVAEGLSRAPAVPGRLEPVENALGLRVLVDYAHTPDGLAQACTAVRDLLGPGSRLVVVFGAGGDRDPEKRPPMGAAVSAAADVAVLTTDNPRHEDPEEIMAAVARGCTGPAELRLESDRRAAIGLALSLAGPGDLVLVAGKGHETTQQVGDELHSFDDRLVVAEEASRLAGAP